MTAVVSPYAVLMPVAARVSPERRASHTLQVLTEGEEEVGEMVTALTQEGSELISMLSRGGLVMVPLLLFSVIALAIVLERSLFWRRLRKQENGEGILALVTSWHLEQAMQSARASRHPVARVLRAGLEQPYALPEMAMQATAQAQLHHLKRYLSLLDTITTLAPLLGLLGTITGMIRAFGIVSEAGLGQPHAITGGVAEALIATATGLSVAILALVPYNYFRGRAEAMTDHIEEHATRLEMLLKMPRVQEEA